MKLSNADEILAKKHNHRYVNDNTTDLQLPKWLQKKLKAQLHQALIAKINKIVGLGESHPHLADFIDRDEVNKIIGDFFDVRP